MDWSEFTTRFGSGFRGKHVNSPFEPTIKKTQQNKRIHFLRKSKDIPGEFIRLDPWEGELLFMLAARAKLGILEIGRYNGGSVFLLACANAAVPIHSIDNQPQDDARLQQLLDRASVGQNVDLIVGDSQNARYPQVGPIDLLFVDGDHSYEGVTADLRNWYDLVSVGGHIVLHDCYHGSPVMDAAWDFVNGHDVTLLRSPFILSAHWNEPAGSMMHVVKRS
jgi:predicted O-methyltransferase YrrM